MHDDERAIRDVIDAWLRASAAHDDAAVLDLMTEDAVFLQPGADPVRGREGFATLQRQLQNVEIDAVADIREIAVSGDWAWCWNHLAVTMRGADGTTSKRAGHVLSVLRRQDGRWRIARDANLLAPVR